MGSSAGQRQEDPERGLQMSQLRRTVQGTEVAPEPDDIYPLPWHPVPPLGCAQQESRVGLGTGVHSVSPTHPPSSSWPLSLQLPSPSPVHPSQLLLATPKALSLAGPSVTSGSPPS